MFMGYDPDILAAERVAVTPGKIPERHPKGATDFCVHLIRGARKAIGRAAATNNSPGESFSGQFLLVMFARGAAELRARAL